MLTNFVHVGSSVIIETGPVSFALAIALATSDVAVDVLPPLSRVRSTVAPTVIPMIRRTATPISSHFKLPPFFGRGSDCCGQSPCCQPVGGCWGL